jgi:putative aminopeptidase FrvX
MYLGGVLSYLKNLSELAGVSGSEDNVRNYIKKEIEQYVDKIAIDSMGNLIAFKKGISSKHKVMLAAHMDEVGFLVTGYTDSGFLKFKRVGGIDERILPGKRVLIGDNKIPGVIGSKAIHMQSDEEFKTNVKLEKMYIDIGCEKREEAESIAPLGEYIVFNTQYEELEGGSIKGKAFDDRAGCAVIMELLKGNYGFDLYGCFTVQEEVGLRGAQIAAYSVNPDIAVVIETTTCSDVSGVEEYEHSTIYGGGAAISFMDRTSYYKRNLVDYIYDTASKNNIKVQFKKTISGGNDAGPIQRTRQGVNVATISIPCRYIHSPVSFVNKNDLYSCLSLMKVLLEEMKDNPVL